MSQSLGVMFDMTAVANADLSLKTFFVLKLVTGGKVDLAGAGERACGILQNKPKSGEGAAVRFTGTSKVVVDGTTPILVNDALKADANGKGVKTTSDGDEVFGFAMEASSADGDIIEVLLVNRQR